MQTDVMPTTRKGAGRPAKIVDAEKFSLRLPREQLEIARRLATADGASVNDVLIAALAAYYEGHPARQLVDHAMAKPARPRRPRRPRRQ